MFLKKIKTLTYTVLDRQEKKYLLSIIVAAIVVKLFLILQSEIINPDGVRYLNSAHELFQGHVAKAFKYDRNLVFSAILGLFNLIIPNGFMAGKMLSCLFLLLSTIPIYFITRELFGCKAAVAAVLIFSTFPTINSLSISIVREPPFLFFFLLAVWCAILALKNKDWRFLGAVGLFTLAAGAFRLEALLLYPILSLYLLFFACKDNQHRSFYGKGILAVTAFPLFCLGAVLLVCLLDTGFALALEKLYLRFLDHYVKEGFLSRYLSLYEFLKNSEMKVSGGVNPDDFFEIARHNLFLVYLIGLIKSFLSSLTPLLILPFFYGLNFKNRLDRNSPLITTVILVYLLGGYLFLLTRNYISARYLFVPVILCIPYMGHGFERLADLLERRRYGRPVFVLIFSFVLLLPLASSFGKIEDEKTEIKIAGEWLQSEGLHTSRILTNDERIPFYAGLFRNEYRRMNFNQINRWAKKNVSKLKKYDVIALRSSDKNNIVAKTPFNGFQMVKKFGSDDEIVLIYTSVDKL